MIIGVDVDSVVCNTTHCVLQQHYEDTGELLTIDDIKSYYIENYVGDDYKDDFYLIFYKKEMWKRLELIPYCVDVIESLHNRGEIIYFITSSEIENLPKKARFLQRTFPFLNVRKRFITTQNKQMIKCDVLIDDYEKHLICGDYQGILMNYPWNANFDDAAYDNIIRVNNWLEIEPVIDFIQRRKSI
jgi:5'(3')-deoxyribonucleotidase